MARTKIARICFDRILEGEQLQKAIEMAFNERLDNAPILPGGAGDEPPSPIELALFTRTLWKPGRTLHVRFLDGADVVQNKVEAVAHMWEQFANIKFQFDDSPDAEIRVAFTPNAGSWSYLGTDALTIPKNQATMNYGWLQPNTSDTEYHRVVLHEFGHSLGCIHEHQNPSATIPWNREKVYKTYGGSPNFWSRQQVDVNLFQKYGADQTQFTDFDTHSIMLYPITKDLTDGTFEVGWNTELSDRDKDFIRAMYPMDENPAVELIVDAPETSADIGASGEEDIYCFQVSVGGAFTVETTGRTDVLMGLFGPNDAKKQIAQDDDSGTGLNARITQALAPGEYYVRVRHFRPKGTGKYGISVKHAS